PGSLHKLTGIIAAHGANIINLVNDRLADVPIGRAMLRITVEAKGLQHLNEIKTAIKETGFDII
ncbi:MAG: hypothetical protein AABY58_01650, partial [Nitrospirota bacterium]